MWLKRFLAIYRYDGKCELLATECTVHAGEKLVIREVSSITSEGQLPARLLAERRRVRTLTENRPIGNSIKLYVESRDG